MRRQCVYLAGFMFVVAALMVSACRSSPDLRVVRDESSFSGFDVRGDSVHIVCSVTVENSTPHRKTFRLEAMLPGDVAGGLLKKARLKGYDEDLVTEEFTVDAESSATLRVTFVGESAGGKRKQSKLLPEIDIIPVE